MRGARAFRRARRVSGLMSPRYRVLPNFLLIGAQRSGTTSLYQALRRHPQIAGPIVKEVHFFDHQYWRGVDWYGSYFPVVAARERARRRGSDLLAGEATPYYLFHPGVPARVAETIPAVLLITILRNPVDRAYSHYRKMVQRKIEPLSFENALVAEESRLAGEEERLLADPRYRSFHHRHHAYVSRGLYADQIARWLALFPRKHLLVLRAEDFFTRPADVYKRTLSFLELDPFDPGEYSAGNSGSYDPLDKEVRANLERRFAEPNAHLSRLLGCESWWPATPARR